jgi:hypothetical protein
MLKRPSFFIGGSIFWLSQRKTTPNECGGIAGCVTTQQNALSLCSTYAYDI